MFFERMANGWELARQSWSVLMEDKKLLVFPLISGIACMLVLASFVAPLWATGYADVVMEDQSKLQDPFSIIILFAFYFANYFVIAFFNSALVACVICRFQGEEASLSDGLRMAMARLPQIAGWALVGATVGVALKLLEQHSEHLGKIVAALIGTAWAIGTYFVVPVIVVERVGPIEAAKRSMRIMRATWGEALSANFGIGFIQFIAFIIAAVPLVLGGMALAGGQAVVGVILLAVGIVAMIVVALISSALETIVIAAVYQYASKGFIPTNFSQNLMRNAFK